MVVLDLLSDPFSVLLLLLVILVVFAVRSLQKPSAGFPPGPRGWPFIGSIADFSDDDPVTTLASYQKKYGDVFSFKMGRDWIVMLNEFEIAKEALIKKQTDFAGRPLTMYSFELYSEGGQDIIFGDFTPKWKFLRKIGHQAMRNYASGSKLEDLVRDEAFPRLQKAIDENNGKPFNPQPILLLVVANVIASMCFAQTYEFDDPEFKRILEIQKEANEITGNGLIADFIPIFKYVPTLGLTTYKRNLVEWFGLIQGKIDKQKKAFEEGNSSHDLVHDILEIQNQAKESGEDQGHTITDTNLRLTTADIFEAGMDTSVNTLNWCIAYLTNYPDVQRKVQEEIEDVIGQGRLPVLSDKGKLPYSEAVLHEIMRIRAVAPMGAPHKTTCNTSVGGYNIPKGTQVWFNIWNMHMDERYWDAPEEFKPERFLDEDGKALPKPNSYLPFSAGRRVCLGEALAKNELFLIFVALFQRYTFLPPPGKDKPDLTPFTAGFVTRCLPYEVVARDRIDTANDP